MRSPGSSKRHKHNTSPTSHCPPVPFLVITHQYMTFLTNKLTIPAFLFVAQHPVYACVISEEQHTTVGKETGETAHVERWNNTLRQRLARFVRMTLSFSKSEVMHEACLLLFLHRYNAERAILLK